MRANSHVLITLVIRTITAYVLYDPVHLDSAGGYVYPLPPLPPLPLDEPPVYLPPPTFPEQLPPSYLPPNDDTVSISAPAVPRHQVKVENMSCVRDTHFGVTLEMSTAQIPLLLVTNGAARNCLSSIGSNTFRVDLNGYEDLSKCGVKRCAANKEGENMCLSVRLPTVNGVRLPEDRTVTLMCTPQEKVVSQTKHLKLGSNKIRPESRSRTNGNAFLATGGTRKDLKTNVAIFRKRSGGSDSVFDRPIEADAVLQLGEELALRTTVSAEDGWKSTRIGPVLVTGVNSKKSALLVDQHGCVNPAMRSICPKPPFRLDPLTMEVHFRAFLFEEASQSDDIVLSVRIQGCLHPQDCLQAESCVESGFAGSARSKRNLEPLNRSVTDNEPVKNWDSFVIFKVKNADNSALINNRQYHHYTSLAVLLMGLILSGCCAIVLLQQRYRTTH